MGKISSDFYGDSSSAVGLTHNATRAEEATSDPKRRRYGQRVSSIRPADRGDAVAEAGGGIQRWDLEERATIDRHRAEDKAKRVRDLIDRFGMTKRQAAEFEAKEAAIPRADRARSTREERAEKFMASLMGTRRKVHAGGSKSKSKNKQPNTGTWVCRDCKLEYCEHRPKRQRGRPKTDRTERVAARVSKTTKRLLRKARLTTADMLELSVTAMALQDRRPFGDVIAEFRARKLQRSMIEIKAKKDSRPIRARGARGAQPAA